VAVPSSVRVTPIGGLGEVGRNMMVVEHGDTRVVIDCGIGFPHGTERGMGVDIYLPDVRALRGQPIDAVLLTHAHDDHVAALAHLIRTGTPIGRIISLPFTIAMVEAKLAEHPLPIPPLRSVRPGDVIDIGDLTVEFVRVAHSIPDAAGIILGTGIGPVVVTGDYKLEAAGMPERRRFDLERFRALGDAGVTALLSDSTNAMLPGRTPSEATTAGPIAEAIAAAPGRVIVTSFSSHIDRVGHALAAADATGRQTMLLGRSLRRNMKVANRLAEVEEPSLLPLGRRDLDGNPNALVICTGSQAEEFAVLSRAARGEHPDLNPGRGDTVIFASRPVPGNEGEVEQLQGQLRQRGVEIITHQDMAVHVSGHARSDEIAELLRLVQPQVLVPIHGEFPMLEAQAALGVGAGIDPERIHVGDCGQVIEIEREGVRVVDEIPVAAIPAGSDGLPIEAGEPG
jgi:ribonuclease J